jgi:hypothetical protein
MLDRSPAWTVFSGLFTDFAQNPGINDIDIGQRVAFVAATAQEHPERNREEEMFLVALTDLCGRCFECSVSDHPGGKK